MPLLCQPNERCSISTSRQSDLQIENAVIETHKPGWTNYGTMLVIYLLNTSDNSSKDFVIVLDLLVFILVCHLEHH